MSGTKTGQEERASQPAMPVSCTGHPVAYRFRPEGMPDAHGLYDPANEHDACGIGLIADISNRKSHAIVASGLKVLRNLEHRGAVGADPKAGDGCGALIQIPHAFFSEEAKALGFSLPAPGEYGVGFLFMPRVPVIRAEIERIWWETAREEGLKVLGWRTCQPTTGCSANR